MILLADSGSTKTDWKLIKGNEVVSSFQTIGFNPYIISSDAILEELNSSKLNAVKEEVSQVHLYAAGCATSVNQLVLQKPLSLFFSNAKVAVSHDMLAAARATCGNEKGMVAILGTGSNSCLYDGAEIIDNIRALGYVLGDYGSGADIGKAFLKKVLAKEFNEVLQAKFDSLIDVDDVLENVYKKPLPNRYLAGFSKFVHQHIHKEEMRTIVIDCLKKFFETNICKYTDYTNYKLHIVGSVGLVYKDLIEEVAANYGVELGIVIKTPIDELVNYHLA